MQLTTMPHMQTLAKALARQVRAQIPRAQILGLVPFWLVVNRDQRTYSVRFAGGKEKPWLADGEESAEFSVRCDATDEQIGRVVHEELIGLCDTLEIGDDEIGRERVADATQ